MVSALTSDSVASGLTETLFTRRRTPRPPAGAPPRGGPRSGRGHLSALDQEDSSRGAVTIQDFQRSTDQFVGARFDGPEIERFDDHDVRGEQRLVDRISRFLRPLRFDGEIVDPDELYAVIDAPLRGTRVERGEVAREWGIRVAPSIAVARLEEDPLGPFRDSGTVEPRSGDVTGAFVLDDATRSDQRIEWEFVDGVSALDEMKGRIDVGTDVIAECDDRDVVGITAGDSFERLDPRRWLTGPRDHVGPEDQRNVVDLHRRAE